MGFKKIYVSGNYFLIIDQDTGRKFEGLAKDVRVRASTLDSTDFYFDNVNGWEPQLKINISEMQDNVGDAYTAESWGIFYVNNTGYQEKSNIGNVMIVEASKLITETTVNVQTAKDDYIISVADSTSFEIGQYLTIYNEISNRVYFGTILLVNGLLITLDTPLDFEFPVGSYVSVGNVDMSVDGSVTPQIFGIRNPTGVDIPLVFEVTRLMFKCLTSTPPDLSKFGDIVGGITRGLVARKKDGTYNNIFNIKTNGELKQLCFDLDIEPVVGNQQDGFTARFTLTNLNTSVILGKDEDLQFMIQDNLLTLDFLGIKAEGIQLGV